MAIRKALFRRDAALKTEPSDSACTHSQYTNTLSNANHRNSLLDFHKRNKHGSERSIACISRSQKEEAAATHQRIEDATLSNIMPILPVFRYDYSCKPVDSKTKQIRILEILPGKGTEPLRCSISRTFLGAPDMTPYETISYCWGDDPGVARIEIDNVPVQVTRSAAEALHRTRNPLHARQLWIDAICINQDDLTEKSAQVAIMGDVYRCTWRNLVWLGPDMGHASMAARSLQRVQDDIQLKTKHCGGLWTVVHDNAGYFRTDGRLIDRSIDLMSLHHIFECPWFSRRWVAQEVALAPLTSCYYGSTIFPFENILRAAVWISFNRNSISHRERHCTGIKTATGLWYLVDHQWTMSHTKRDLYSLCDILEDTFAKEPADKVYALLGMFQPKSPDMHACTAYLTPDYAKPVVDIHRDATRAMIEDTKLLRVFHEIHLDEADNLPPGPSWMYHFAKLPKAPVAFSHSYFASCESYVLGPTLVQSGDLKVLRLRGFVVDEIMECTRVFDPRAAEGYENVVRTFFSDISVSVRKLSDRALPDREIIDELAYTLSADWNWQRQIMGPQDLHNFSVFLSYVRENGDIPPPMSSNETQDYDKDTQAAMLYSSSFSSTCFRRRFYITKGNRMGIGPAASRPGDIITVLFGGTMPYVLRPVKGNRFQLIGAAYLNGVMQGEAMRAHVSNEEADLDFEVI